MDGEAFDLVGTISDLLRRIDEGRKTIRETGDVRQEFLKTCADRDCVHRRFQELQRKMPCLNEPAKSGAGAELDRLKAEYQRLDSMSSELWPSFNEATAFIDPFTSDLKWLLKRLPLTSDWDAYREAVGGLDVSSEDCWKDPPTMPALGTLQIRLQEMLDLATRNQRAAVGRFDVFPTPKGSSWKDVSITFIGDYRVQITVLKIRETRNYAEMGFEDRRGGGGKPTSAWDLLRLLAKETGWIRRPKEFNGPQWSKVEKQVQKIRERLRELFGIPGDPLPFRKHLGYEAEFAIKLGDSVEY